MRWCFCAILALQFLTCDCFATIYEKPADLDEALWERLEPYFLPEDHPIRPILDRIFSASRVTLSGRTLKKAGFSPVKPRKVTHLIVTKHPDLPQYIFKIYSDAQRYYHGNPEYECWIERIEGAQNVRDEISRCGWSHLFSVPEKWIYPLPPEPSPPRHCIRKNFILVETDMELLSESDNKEMWENVDCFLLESLFHMLQELGLRDCAKIDNVPFTKNGRVAFVDTQTHHTWPIRFKSLLSSLSKESRKVWKALISDSK